MPQETVGYVKLEWTCKRCGSKNPGTTRICAACGNVMSEADKFDLQQYITRCYGSLTTFNILFKNKDDQFRTSAADKPNS